MLANTLLSLAVALLAPATEPIGATQDQIASAESAGPEYTTVGFAYMLGGDAAVSNTDPYATAPTDANEWVTGVEAHLMMLIPDDSLLASIPTNHRNGGPWIMWGGTPYAHIMIPIDSYDGGGH